MKTPSFFKLSTEAAKHLEAALVFFGRSGHKTNKTELVERSIFTLPTSEEQVRDSQRADRAKPVPPLLAAFRDWQSGKNLTRSQLLHLAEEAYEGVRRHRGFYRHELIADMLRAFKAVRGLRHANARTPDLDGLDEYYLENLVEKRSGGLLPSVEATIGLILDPYFSGSPDYPCRNLHAALRDEPPLETATLNRVLLPYLPTIFRLAIRRHCIETGNLFTDPEARQPPPSEYWKKIHKSGAIVQGAWKLNWGRDHSTSGGTLTIETDKGEISLELRSFPVFWDLFYLIENVVDGGPGGTRGEFTFERNREALSNEGGVSLAVGQKLGRASFALNSEMTVDLLKLAECVFSESELTDVRNSLCWIHGDI